MKQLKYIQKWKILLSLLVSLLLTNNVCADVYRMIDKEGNQHFAERKVDSTYHLILKSDSNTSSNSFNTQKRKNVTVVRVPRNKTLQKKYHPLILQAANLYHLEPSFIHAVITAESSYQYNAVSSAGAQGLMQLMPETALRFGVNDPFDPKQSIHAGTEYLYTLLQEFKSKELALAAYNAGEGTVRRYNKTIPPYPETEHYINKVMGFYWYYRNSL
ncbi:Lytic transglycosylase, catalytic [Psychromonas ingrahamii 37]|uniref:Lytic transglycosylase, catalytic n=1 Tax=Psychromonas ingrahamii (strain DSM 17664 / CCUG 51855 / 37) TaxID=357804 RepID=A1SRW4_PSYIN|nr:lytic transglycosylase domain-containing protein [Psychromonas ingrahamii]ABM02229.1 Lytic transglycosylase, catalytic [Psychromonas ingrahamii 37]